MSEVELLQSTVSEYGRLLASAQREGATRLDMEGLIERLSGQHEWTEQGARAIVSLANDYGAFMLRNALALSLVLDKQDGEIGF